MIYNWQKKKKMVRFLTNPHVGYHWELTFKTSMLKDNTSIEMKSSFSTSPSSACPAPNFILGNTMNEGGIKLGKMRSISSDSPSYTLDKSELGEERWLYLKISWKFWLLQLLLNWEYVLRLKALEEDSQGLPGCS